MTRDPSPNPTADDHGAVIALHKPWGYLSQFTADDSKHRPLSELHLPARVFPVGRLDADSEGLLILSANRAITAQLLSNTKRHPREYWVQVEHKPDEAALAKLRAPMQMKGYLTRPCSAWLMKAPPLQERDPPIRFRKTIPTAWIGIELDEGRNRQVRRMTAAIGHPTLRLFRARVGGYELGTLPRGNAHTLDTDDIEKLLSRPCSFGVQNVVADAP